jgi:hypothetical protein
MTTTLPTNIGIIIAEKTGTLKELIVKEFKEEELFKKCGFKKGDGFVKQTEWSLKMDGKKIIVALYAKTEGKANTENKYDFPPPVDTKLFFGACAIVCYSSSSSSSESTTKPQSINLEQWNKFYEKLFGGFEDLAATCAEDDYEIDELAGVPADKKTKNGYLKDGFVVDSEEDDENAVYESEEDDEDEDEEETEEEEEGDLIIEDIGSELSEEAYEDESDTN